MSEGYGHNDESPAGVRTTSPVHDPSAAARARLRPPFNPLAMLISPLGWGAVAYCASSIIGGLLALGAGILGILVLPLMTWCTATLESHRLRLLGLPFPGPLPSGTMRHPWDPGGLKEGNLAVWGVAVLFAIVDLLPGLMLSLLVIGLWASLMRLVIGGHAFGVDHFMVGTGLLVVLVVGLYVAWALAAVQALIVDHLVRPKVELTEQVEQLTTSRRELVDVFAAERRRIERDLHDGAQQQLVLLSMQLGEADYALAQGRPDEAKLALAAAQQSMEHAMVSLRETVRGVHPQILTDRGLVPAVHELAQRQPTPVTVIVERDGQPPEHLASAAYYLISEGFTNAAKHAGASSMVVRLDLGDPVVIEVQDDGRGGAQVRPGHGLSGMIERVQAFGGRCSLSSPPGGPTSIRAMIPNPPG